MFKKKIYLAAGWFNPIQALELTQLEEVCDNRDWIDLASPRRIFVCPPNAPKHVQDETFDGNLHGAKTYIFVISNMTFVICLNSHSRTRGVAKVRFCIAIKHGKQTKRLIPM